MRAQQVIIGAVLGSMLLGMAGAMVTRQNGAYLTGLAIEANFADFKASLAGAVSAAEEKVSGIAKSVRIDRSHGEPCWIASVDAGKMHQDAQRGRRSRRRSLRKMAQAVPSTKPEPDAQSGTAAKATPAAGSGTADTLKTAPSAIAPANPIQGKTS